MLPMRILNSNKGGLKVKKTLEDKEMDWGMLGERKECFLKVG